MRPSAVGVSSFAFRYGIGIPGCTPADPLSVKGCMDRSIAMGFSSIQLCENLHFKDMADETLRMWADHGRSLDLRIEIGMNGLDLDGLHRHIDICRLFQSDFLRVVIGDRQGSASMDSLVSTIRRVVPLLHRYSITMGIENHFDLPTPAIRSVLDTVDDPAVGAVFDTTNGIGFLEKPLDTLAILGDRILSVHLKDYYIRKAEASYVITGAVLGQGQLPLAELLDAIRLYNPQARLALESTIRRRDGRSPEEAADDEQVQLAACLDHLIAYLTHKETTC